uniref:Uncharacterized protein LOC104210138 n=1 Tax=Nicotiana sylvestris TaxID=4096 RepID=A0A1U7V6A4_NICSY|nr:PREDICTED: uncharacterized protein LOC104210138 [Nicotiana sylvestris]
MNRVYPDGCNHVTTSWNNRQRDQELMEYSPEERLLSTSINPPTHKPSSPSAEARLSNESHFLIPSSGGRSESDYFLRIWNSEIGEAFRNFKKVDKNTSQSPASQVSTTTNYGSTSGITTEMDLNFSSSSVGRSNKNEDSNHLVEICCLDQTTIWRKILNQHYNFFGFL